MSGNQLIHSNVFILTTNCVGKTKLLVFTFTILYIINITWSGQVFETSNIFESKVDLIFMILAF